MIIYKTITVNFATQMNTVLHYYYGNNIQELI